VLWVGSSAGLYQLNRDSQAFTLSSFGGSHHNSRGCRRPTLGGLLRCVSARSGNQSGQASRTWGAVDTDYPFWLRYGWLMGEDRGRPVVGGAGWNAGFATLYARYPEMD